MILPLLFTSWTFPFLYDPIEFCGLWGCQRGFNPILHCGSEICWVGWDLWERAPPSSLPLVFYLCDTLMPSMSPTLTMVCHCTGNWSSLNVPCVVATGGLAISLLFWWDMISCSALTLPPLLMAFSHLCERF